MQNTGININRLKGKIVEKGMSISSMAEKMGIDRATLYRRLENSGSGLLVKDATLISEILDLTSSEALSIFFPRYVA